MATPKLVYFTLPGRAEPIRLAFKISGQSFEDHRIDFNKDWPALKSNTPWGSLPILEVDGKVIAQSNNILRFVGRRTGLYPTNYPAEEFTMAQIDELLDAAEDAITLIAQTITLPDGEAKLAKRKELLEGPLSAFLERIEKRLAANGGKFFVGTKLTIADLKIFPFLNWLSSGVLDGIPKTVLEKYTNLSSFKNGIVEIAYKK